MGLCIRRLSLIGACGAIVLAVTAAPASAQSALTTGATSVNTNSAVLHGVATTDGLVTSWQFQYGKRATYGESAPTTAGTIGAGKGTVPVSTKITGLSPGTTYHFRLAISYTGPAPQYYLLPSYGADTTFKTATVPGHLRLTGTKLKVEHGHVSIPFQCASSIGCRAPIALTTQATVRFLGRKFSVTIACLSASINLGANKKRTVTPKLSSFCEQLLTTATHHKINGSLTAIPTTGQSGINNKSVSLKGT